MKDLKRFFCVFLTVLMLMSIVPMSDMGIEASALSPTYAVSTSYKNSSYYSYLRNVNLTGNQRNDIVSVALSQVGYREGSSSNDYSGANDGSYNNYTEYNYWYHNYVNADMPVGGEYASWCATFVSWCAEQANISSSIIKRSTRAGHGADYFNVNFYAGSSTLASSGDKDSYFKGYNYTPKSGDLFFTRSWSHVGIVVSVSGSNVITVEGNTNNTGSPQGNGVYKLTSRKISDLYFGVPNYKNTTVPGKPVLSISDKNTSTKEVTFSWNKTTNTDHYDLRIYNHGDYNTGAPYYKFDISADTTSTTMKFPAGKYAAYITAVSSNGTSTASDWITVFDVVDPPGKCVLTATPGKMVTKGVTFNWTKAENAHTYDLRVYNYGDYNVGAPYGEFGMSSSTTSTIIKLPVGKYAAYITAKASNGASDGGGSEWITFTVSEPTADSNYPADIKGYKMWIGETATQVFDTQTLNGYYLDDNEITIVSIYTNDWAKIKHIVDGTEKTAYVPLGGLISDKVQPYKMYLKGSADVYSRYTCETKQSSQPKDKEVTVIGYYKTDLAQICYTVNNTNYIGWIEKDNLIDHIGETYTITYNSNGGTGAPSPQTKTEGVNLTLSSTEPTRAGYSFRGWSTNSSATTPTYIPGSTYSTNSGATLYAVWKKVFYGNIYNDDVINDGDTLYAAQVVEGLKSASSYAVFLGDVDGDGSLTSDDVDLIAQYNMKTIHSFPVEELHTVMNVYDMPYKTLYKQNEPIVATGLKLAIMHYDSSSASIYKAYHLINAGYKISPELSSGSGTQNITVDIGGGLKTSYSIYVDSEIPTKGSVAVYYDSDDTTKLNITLRDNYSVDGYYWGTNSNVENNAFYDITDKSSETIYKSISKEGLYYFAIKDTAGNLSDVYKFEFCKLALNGNNGTVEKDCIIVYNGDSITLPSASRSGYTLKGWSTSSTATKAEYAVGGTYKVSSNVTLYAVWEANHTHSYTSRVINEATCVKTGTKKYSCSCGSSYTETIAKNASNHTGGTEIKNAKSATCTAEGYTGDTYCKGCGVKTKSGTAIAKTAHNSNTTIPAVAATCTKTGLTEGKKCSVCGTVTVTQQTVAKLAHSYTSKVTTAATCKAEGVKTYTCSKCSYSYTETIAKNASNHTGGTEIKNAKSATCTAEGYTGDTYCEGCGVKTKSGTAIAKTAHNSNTTIPAVAATCTKTGLTEGKKCSVCGTVTVAQQTVAKTSHTYGSWEVTKTATCTVAGTRQKACTACGNTVTETVKALGHTFGSYKSDNNATYKDDGTKTAKCTRCNATKTVSDPGSRLVVKKPYTVKVEQNASAIRLTWNKCEGATGYRIYYKVGSTWKIALNATTKTTHTFTGLKSGTSFTLAIRPYVIANGSVIWSDYLTVTASTAPVAPVAKASSPSKGRITVSWNNVTGGQKYQLFYKSGNGGYKLYNTYDKATSLTFKNLKSGTRFTFAVRAYRTVGGRTIYSSYTPVSVTVK